MIPTIVTTNAISQPSRTGPVTPVTATPDSLQSTPEFTLGQRYQAVIDARLANGTAKVFVAGQLLQMNLPDNLPSGSKIDLVFIGREPQLKFLLQNNVLSSNANKNLAEISATGRFLGGLLQDAGKSVALPLLLRTLPVLNHPPINSVGIPTLLQKSLSQSGLFYESHQSQWLTGGKNLAQLKQEPQGKLTNELTLVNRAAGVNADFEMSIHAQSLPLVRQQLTTLETNHLIWHGEIWPDQSMDWEVSENNSDENHPGSEESPAPWQTQLRLTLPNLGGVAATIMIDASNVRIKLHADTEVVELLKSNQSLLTTAMISTGLNMQSLEVLNNDEA